MIFRPLLCLVFALLVSIAPNRARAEVINTSSIRCEDYLTMESERAAKFTVFLVGYYSAVKGVTEIDTDKVDAAVEKVKSLCASNPNTSVMSLIEHEFGLVPPQRVYRPAVAQ